VLNCADYGDPTTRERLFVMARRSKPIVWPAPSHVGRWKAAREVIDWGLKGKSIFTRKKPLSANTLRRIEAGLRKFGGESFVVQWDQTGSGGPCVRSVDRPLQTLVTKQNLGLVEPFIVHLRGTQPSQVNASARSVEEPVPTLTASGGHVALCEPFILPLEGFHRGNAPRSVEQPLPTITSRGGGALIEPFLIGQQSCAAARPVSEPLPTVAAAGAIALVEPFLVTYYGTGQARPVSAPLDTVTARDRFGLAMPEVQFDGQTCLLDIRFRMLQLHELAAAMSFPADYKFAGNREAGVKQVGNAVPVETAAALCKELMR
jgi:DNA (cytosine-5)-methyltransferase 1